MRCILYSNFPRTRKCSKSNQPRASFSFSNRPKKRIRPRCLIKFSSTEARIIPRDAKNHLNNHSLDLEKVLPWNDFHEPPKQGNATLPSGIPNSCIQLVISFAPKTPIPTYATSHQVFSNIKKGTIHPRFSDVFGPFSKLFPAWVFSRSIGECGNRKASIFSWEEMLPKFGSIRSVLVLPHWSALPFSIQRIAFQS